MPDYVVEPPDLLIVEVLEALPGRPISGERLVRPDGKISLGFYGDVYVAGLTIPEVKEKIVLHLRKYLTDEASGWSSIDDTGEPAWTRRPRKPKLIDPKDSDRRVFVDVTAYNSKNYYVLGDVLIPGRLPITGNETVLDAIEYRRRPAADGRASEHPPGPPGSARRLLRAGPAGQPGRDHQRRRPDDQLSAHARRPDHRLSRPDRPLHGLPRSAGRTVPDRPRARHCRPAFTIRVRQVLQDCRRPGPVGPPGRLRRRGPVTNLPLEPGAR